MATSGRSLLCLAGLVAALAAAGAEAARPGEEGLPRVSAGRPGPIVDTPTRRGEAELVTFDHRLAPSLAALAPEESLLVEEWPVAPGVRRPVRLTRHEIYAPDSRILRVDGPLVIEIPRSRLIFLWGSDVDGGETRLVVSVDPDSGRLGALSRSPYGFHEIVPEQGGRQGRYLLARPEDLVTADAPRWSCHQEDAPDASFDRSSRAGPARDALDRTAELITTLHTATVAFDTDNELMLLKFGDNTTSATNYIASLVASINVMYERDLLLRLVQGFTVLRVSTTADPFSQTGSPASFAELSEFGNYWSANYGSVTRAVTAMLSGKSSAPNSASGIAWLGGLCSKGTGYSFSQVFRISYLAGDTLIVGHEIGHNLSSPHTHCYSTSPLPAPDHCWNQESCYSGATSCPAPQTINGVTNVTGTLMSYCHMLLGCSTSLVFHPRTVSEYAGPAIQNAVGTCVFPLSAPPPSSTRFYTLTPCRVVDTRGGAPIGGPAFSPSEQRILPLAGYCGIPANASALSVNLTVVPAAAGYMTLFPGNGVNPGSSNINFGAGQVRANNAILRLATDGTGTAAALNGSSGSNHLIVDVNGYFQ